MKQQSRLSDTGIAADKHKRSRNDPSSEHGYGDYLVCPNKDGKPDFSDVWVVNGAVFPSTYDMTNAETEPSAAA
mgnify:CR=1 FL=1